MEEERHALRRSWKAAPEGPIRDTAMALIGCLPFGSLFQLAAGRFWQDPTQTRMQTLLLELAQDINKLSARDEIDPATLLARDEVQPVLAQAIDAAAKTLGKEKLTAIRNAAFRGITNAEADFDTTSMVFSILNQLANFHFFILRSVVDLIHPAIGGVAADDLHTVGALVAPPPKDRGQNAPDGPYFDPSIVARNKLAIDDLVTLGVVERRYETPKSFNDFNVSPSENLPASYHLTARGSALYDYVFAPPSIDN